MKSHEVKYRFSIIIPTRNRARFLSIVLHRVSLLKYDTSVFEVIVVDNASSDETKVVVQRFKSESPNICTSYLYEAKIGPSYARNRGIKKARFSYILCLDDDVLVESDLLARYKNIFKRYPKAAIVGGKNVATSEKQKRLSFFISILGENAWVFTHTTKRAKRITEIFYPDMLTSANICINTNVTGKIFFDSRFGKVYGKNLVFAEDTELCLRTLLSDKKIYYDPHLITRHVICDSKLKYSYIFKRFFLAGVEQHMLDEYLVKMGAVKLYNSNKNIIKYDIKTLCQNLNFFSFMKLVADTLFARGYYSKEAKSILKEFSRRSLTFF
jgi:glycosyltransferase involved in cell wall biosynthesis